MADAMPVHAAISVTANGTAPVPLALGAAVELQHDVEIVGDGGNEQMFGAKQQVPARGQSD